MTNEEAIKVLLDEWKCIDRNDGINCDRKCESCDLVMDSFVLRDAYNAAIKALSYDDAKYHEEHGEVIVDKAVWEDAKKALEQQSMPTMVYPQVEGITPVVVEPIPKLPPVNQQEPCDDAVSRQAVLDLLEDTNNGWIINEVSQLPSVKPQEPKTGHWIAQDIYNCHTDFKCSECGYIHSFMHLYGKPTADYTYCPNCGAKMVEEQERSE